MQDGLGRLTTVVEDPAASIADCGGNTGTDPTTGYGYDARGNLVSVNQSGRLRSFTYDSLARLLSATAPEWGNPGQAGGTTSYQYDEAGNLTGRTDPASYSYDGLNRLKTMYEANTCARTYAYDRYGNRAVVQSAFWCMTQEPWTPQVPSDSPALVEAQFPKNRWTGGTNLSYDPAGNQLSVAGPKSFTYDAENRLATMTQGGTVSYAYDGEGRRVKKTTGANVTTYVYDAFGQLAAEYASPAPASVPCTTCYLTVDHLGSTRMVTDQAGAVVERRDYFPFGEEMPVAGSVRASIAGYPGDAGQALKFTGKERDGESGLDYFGARYMSNAQGRFTGADPYEINQEASKAKSEGQRQSLLNSYISNPQVWNRYAYALNNPLRLVDLNGKCSKPANLQDNQTGVCIEAFIAAPTIGNGLIKGKGDNRTFAATDPSKTARVRIDLRIDPGPNGAITSTVTTARSETNIGLSAQGHTEMIPLSVSTDAQGNRQFDVNFTGINGFAGMPGAPEGAIRADLHFSVTPGGQVSLGNSSITGFPSFGVYSYGAGANGQPQVRTLVEAKEKEPSYLTKPTIPVPRQ